MFRCTLFRRQTDVCYACGKVGHRADVCPTPDDVICRGCGKQSPSEEHDCKPMCKLCGGAHVTADRKCKQRFQIPYVVSHRIKERQKQDSNPCFQRGYTAEDFPPLHTVKPGGYECYPRPIPLQGQPILIKREIGLHSKITLQDSIGSHHNARG
ncbi:hypothetical protein MTO96_038127 [Rhipicephalus appendiculatus]